MATTAAKKVQDMSRQRDDVADEAKRYIYICVCVCIVKIYICKYICIYSDKFF